MLNENDFDAESSDMFKIVSGHVCQKKGKHVRIKVYGVYGGLEDNPVVIDRKRV